MASNYFAKGQWNFICDVCGREMKSSVARLRWDGFWVCPGDWEPRQPQDFVRGRPDKQTPAWTRPEPPDQFVPATACTAIGKSGAAGQAISGCSITGRPAMGT